jgi:hypothetical protein
MSVPFAAHLLRLTMSPDGVAEGEADPNEHSKAATYSR